MYSSVMMLRGGCFPMFNSECCRARRFERIDLISQRKRESAQVEKMTRKLVPWLWFSRKRAFWYEVLLVGRVSGRESYQRTFLIDALDANSWSEPIRTFAPPFVRVCPEAKREASRKEAACRRRIER